MTITLNRAATLPLLVLLGGAAQAACPPVPPLPGPPPGEYVVITGSKTAKAARAYVLVGQTTQTTTDCVVHKQNSALKATKWTIAKGTPCTCHRAGPDATAGLQLTLKPRQYHCQAGVTATGVPLLARCEARK